MGFKLDIWDFITFASIFVIVVGAVALVVFLMGLPGRIAIARKHPDAEAVNMMGWLGFLAVVPWMTAFIWSFKPTNIIDIRRTPREAAVHLAKTGAAPEEESLEWVAQVVVDEAAVRETQAEADRARLRYESEIGGVNTSVAEAQAELDQALYYLDNTTLVAPEDGRIINLQVRPGMVSGDWRIGAIASFICEADRYLLASYNAESLKFVNMGQPVEGICPSTKI